MTGLNETKKGVDYTCVSDAELLFGGIKSRYVGITESSDYYALSFRERVFAIYVNEFDRDCDCVRCCLSHGGCIDDLIDFICFITRFVCHLI